MPIQLKNSNTAGHTPGSTLALGEVALNHADKKAFVRKSDGSGNEELATWFAAGTDHTQVCEQLLPFKAEFPTSNYPALMTVNGRPVLAFDAATAETCFWTFIADKDLTGPLTVTGYFMMASATSGKVDFEVAVEAVTPGDALDLDATTSFATANAITAPTVPATAGYLGSFQATLTNDDGIAAGDLVRISIKRDAADATNDTATGDCYLLAAAFRNAA